MKAASIHLPVAGELKPNIQVSKETQAEENAFNSQNTFDPSDTNRAQSDIGNNGKISPNERSTTYHDNHLLHESSLNHSDEHSMRNLSKLASHEQTTSMIAHKEMTVDEERE